MEQIVYLERVWGNERFSDFVGVLPGAGVVTKRKCMGRGQIALTPRPPLPIAALGEGEKDGSERHSRIVEPPGLLEDAAAQVGDFGRAAGIPG
jgi:hypothetical protein